MKPEMSFGLQSDLFHDELSEKEVQAALKAGFTFFEMWGMEPYFPLEQPEEADRVRSLLEKSMYRPSSYKEPNIQVRISWRHPGLISH